MDMAKRLSRAERNERIALAGLGVSVASLGVSIVSLLNKKPELRSEGKTLQRLKK